ncbi:MAG: NAD-dependent epimerase/dehydratase family protein [Candidatus Omnitrophota bacterium]|jgi:nucleoside-diphosphate-sugar epimerase
MNKKIAILGATSHIAKGLIYNFVISGSNKMFLFARSSKRVGNFLRKNSLKGGIFVEGFKDFHSHEYDVIINCVGLGVPNKIKDSLGLVFQLNEEFDSMLLSYLDKHPLSRCINFSSGAVYGNSFNSKIREDRLSKIDINNIKAQDYYCIAKINSEAKHRARQDLNIIDIRVFSYFSRFIDLDSGYFLSEIVKSVKENKELVTDSSDFVRDYLGPADLFNLVKLIIKHEPFNGPLDAYSRRPVSKFELLEFFVKKYALRYIIDNKIKFSYPIGRKNVYSPNSRAAAKIGYKPRFSSIEAVKLESELLLSRE